MEFEVNINRKHGMILAFALVFLLGSIVVYAYSSTFTGGNPSVMGHSADEVNVFIDGFAGPITTQSAFDVFFGKTVCKISSDDLKNKGCPSGSYLYRIQKISTPGSSNDAFCRRFYTSYDNSANPYECYISGEPPPESESCGEVLCSAGSHSEPLCCELGTPAFGYICGIRDGNWGWRQQTERPFKVCP